MTTARPNPAGRRALPALGGGFWLKLALVGLLDAVVVLLCPILIASGSWTLLALLLAAALLINYAYLRPGAVALPWLAPGLVFMGLFVVWPVLYTAYVGLTNWSTGHILSKEQAIERLQSIAIETAGDPLTLDLAVFRDPDGVLAFYVTGAGEGGGAGGGAEGSVWFGVPRPRGADPDRGGLLQPAELGVTDEDGDGLPEGIGSYARLQGLQVIGAAGAMEDLVLDVPGGQVEVLTTSSVRLVASGRRYRYDAAADTLYDAQTRSTCRAAVGAFSCPDGRQLDPGWREVIGLANFVRVIADGRFRGPFVRVFVWNIVFAAASVGLTFAVGLTLANALQETRLRGRPIYRSIFIIPYAVPGFISAIVWRGLLNDQFGQVNRVIEFFGAAGVPWLQDRWWAKVAVLLVNTWLGFPYMFLIASGALQSIPDDLKEAARVEGASAARVFGTITLPLLMVATAPMLIGSFAYNFNNFTLIFLLTAGGPPVAGASVPVGHTDILISFTFNLALQAGRGQNFGLGSAIVIVVFVVVAALSAFGFRFTKRLERVYGNL